MLFAVAAALFVAGFVVADRATAGSDDVRVAETGDVGTDRRRPHRRLGSGTHDAAPPRTPTGQPTGPRSSSKRTW